jgi:hypothetical protein
MDNAALFSMITASRNLQHGAGSSEPEDDGFSVKFFVVLCVIFIVPIFINWELPENKYTIEMKLINNEVVVKTYMLPEDYKLGIVATDGTYTLVYETKSNGAYFNLLRVQHTLQYGVIDYKIIKIKK